MKLDPESWLGLAGEIKNKPENYLDSGGKARVDASINSRSCGGTFITRICQHHPSLLSTRAGFRFD
jgi:hypothetical protein